MSNVLVSLSPDPGYLALRFRYDLELLGKVKQIQGRKFKANLGNAWLVPFTKELIDQLPGILAPASVLVDEQVKQVLNLQQVQEKEVLKFRSEPHAIDTMQELNLPPSFKFHTPPFAHQRMALQLCYKHPQFGVFMEMGTGKTKVMLDLIALLKKAGQLGGPVLVVCPVSVIGAWVIEAGRHQPDLQVTQLTGSIKGRQDALRRGLALDHDVFLVNYEASWRMEEDLLKVRWGMMVLDESTRIKHRASKQSKAILRIGKVAKRRYAMTGTPTPNNPLEIFHQFKWMDPTIFGPSFFPFRDRYCLISTYGGFPKITGWKNMDELSKKISGHSYRVLKKDCLDLPEKVYKEFRFTAPEEMHKAYKAMAEDLITEVHGTEVSVSVILAKLTKLRQLTSGFIYKAAGQAVRMEANPKLDKLREVLQEVIPNGHKVIIWVTFKEEVAIIDELCRELGVTTAVLTGATSQEDRAKLIKAFQEDQDPKIFIGQQRAGGMGITLTSADYCIFFSNEYSNEIRLQAEDRLHRIGQRNTVTYIDLLIKGTIDIQIRKSLAQKQELSEHVTPSNVRELIYGGSDF